MKPWGAANTPHFLKAFVVLTPGQTATEQEISAFCRTRLAAYKVPKTGESRDLLPMSAVGKELRRMLRHQETMEKKQQETRRTMAVMSSVRGSEASVRYERSSR